MVRTAASLSVVTAGPDSQSPQLRFSFESGSFLEGNSVLRCQNLSQMLPMTFLGIFLILSSSVFYKKRTLMFYSILLLNDFGSPHCIGQVVWYFFIFAFNEEYQFFKNHPGYCPSVQSL